MRSLKFALPLKCFFFFFNELFLMRNAGKLLCEQALSESPIMNCVSCSDIWESTSVNIRSELALEMEVLSICA